MAAVHITTYPDVPSFATTADIPPNVERNSGGIDVCVLTFTASNGQSAMSAINSAEALAVKYKAVL